MTPKSVLQTIVIVAALLCLLIAAVRPDFQLLIFHSGWLGLFLWLLSGLIK